MSILKKIVEKKQSEKYAWPAGWLTREQAANDLGVAPRDVDEMLRDVIRDGDVERRSFPVWDGRQGRLIKVPGYRPKASSESESGNPTGTASECPDELTDAIIAVHKKHPHVAYCSISTYLPKRLRGKYRVNTKLVRAVLGIK